jgi:hypothetical protein
VKLALALIVVVLLSAGFVVMHGMPGGSSGGEVKVRRAALQPGRIVLTLESHSAETGAIAQAIVNDSYVNFTAGSPDAADIAIDYPWIEGESYDIELLTSTGASVDFAIDDASAS